MARRATEALPPYRWGDCGGRGAHPADPTGEIFGKTHWPKARPHEKLDWTGKTVGHVKPEPTEVLRHECQPALKTTVGLITLDDFLEEAFRNAVLDKVLEERLRSTWDKPLPNEGMRRMQANNLLRNAIKRKGATS